MNKDRVERIRAECSECLRHDSLRGEFTVKDAEVRAGVMCDGIHDGCETKDGCSFVVSLDDKEMPASDLPYFKNSP